MHLRCENWSRARSSHGAMRTAVGINWTPSCGLAFATVITLSEAPTAWTRTRCAKWLYDLKTADTFNHSRLILSLASSRYRLVWSAWQTSCQVRCDGRRLPRSRCANIAVVPPKGPVESGCCWFLHKSMYGTREASRRLCLCASCPYDVRPLGQVSRGPAAHKHVADFITLMVRSRVVRARPPPMQLARIATTRRTCCRTSRAAQASRRGLCTLPSTCHPCSLKRTGRSFTDWPGTCCNTQRNVGTKSTRAHTRNTGSTDGHRLSCRTHKHGSLCHAQSNDSVGTCCRHAKCVEQWRERVPRDREGRCVWHPDTPIASSGCTLASRHPVR